MLLPVQGSELPSCSSLFSQSSLPATSLGQVPLGARARALSALPICAPALMQPHINSFSPLISLLNWPHLFSSIPHSELLSPFLVQPQLSAFPSKSASSSFSSPAGSEPCPRAAWCLFPPPTCAPDSTRQLPAPTLSSPRFNFSPFTLEPAAILALSSLLLCLN